MIKIYIIGRLGADAQLQTTKEGTSYMKLGVASSENIGNAQSGDKWKTTWLDVMVWGKRAEDLFKEGNLKKGSKVFVDGKLDSNEWTDQTGNKRKSYTLVAYTVLVALSAPKKDHYDQPVSPDADGDIDF